MANLFELIKQKFATQPYIEDSNAEWDKSMALEEQKARNEAQFAQKMQRIQNNPKSLEAKLYNFNNNLKDFNLADALLGQQATPTDSMSADGNNLKSTISQNPRTGGILRDISGGYQENRFTPASLDNLGQNTLADGRQKGFAYRLGEGFGSISRLANSPLGRGLIVGGLVSATGGNPLQALAFGGGATMLNQQNVLKDQMYRKDLESQGIDTSGIRGYMGDNVYGQLLKAKQLKDNAEYRKMYFDAQLKQDERDRAWQREKFEYQKRQDAQQNAIAMQKLANDNKPDTPNFTQISSTRKEFASIPAIKNANEIKTQFDNVTNIYNAYKQGKLRANAADQAMVTTLNKILDPTSVVRESEFARTAAGQSFFARVQGYADKISKGGGGLTNAEREDLYNAMQEMYNANQAEANEYVRAYTDLAKRYNINPADIMPRQYVSNASPTTQVGKYQEGQTATNPNTGEKMIFRGGKWQAL